MNKFKNSKARHEQQVREFERKAEKKLIEDRINGTLPKEPRRV